MGAPMKFFPAIVLSICAVALNAVAPTRASAQAGGVAADDSPTWTLALYEPANAPQPELVTSNEPIFAIGLYSGLVVVPSVKGKTWDEARHLLEQANLVATKLSDKATNDDVVNRQNIAPGKKVAAGTEVRLDLKGTVPNVVGMTIGEAFEELESLSDFRMKYNPKWGSDYVITDQKPKAGEPHRRGRDVHVMCMVQVPNVTNMSVEEAKQILTDAKLEAKLPSYFEDTDRVLKQNIRSGRMALAHSRVNLTPGVPVPNLIGLGPRMADDVLRPTGIRASVRYQTVATDSIALSGRAGITYQSVSPGLYIVRGAPFSVTIRKYVYRQRVIIRPDPTTQPSPAPDPPPQSPGGGEYVPVAG